jgi:N-methylhydantoinase A
MRYLGVDTGGTFTDFALFDSAAQSLETFKVRSIPEDPAVAVGNGLGRLRDEFGVPIGSIDRLIFGTTVATNAVLERKGATVALLTTKGMRDVLEIQRQWRRRLFDLYLQKPPPLARRRHRLDVDERIGSAGQIIKDLSEDEIQRCVEELSGHAVDVVAISLLFSFLRPDHEQRLAAAVRRRLPKLPVTISSEVCPEFREYERTATTVMNAYTMPKVAAIAGRLERVLKDLGFNGTFGIIQSNGGIMSLAKARTHAVNTLLSGPAGGCVGATAVAEYSGVRNILGFDVGGTSTDIALIENGEIRLTAEGGIGGYPVKVPQIGIHTIGAGGGSLARPVLGMLKVGPESAGANPGPACYGMGGIEPTGTDAAVALGYIDPDYFVGGEVRLDSAAGRSAIRNKVAVPLNLDPDAAALAILQVQAANIVAGIRKISVEAGKDPREFVLLPFGGAGGIYAGLVAEEAGMTRILLPQHPSVLSALGMLMTDVRHESVQTRLQRLDGLDPADLASSFERLEDQGIAALGKEGIGRGRIRSLMSCDMRYVGQAYEINVPIPPESAVLAAIPTLRQAFDREHLRLYGQCSEKEPVEIVGLRVGTVGMVEKAALQPIAKRAAGSLLPRTHRRILLDAEGGWNSCPVFDRAKLSPDDAFEGPAIVEDRGSSFVLRARHQLGVDAYGNIHVTVPTAGLAAREQASSP